MSRAREVVEVVARALADRPDAVRVTERTGRGQTVVELSMARGDLGRVIGRQVPEPGDTVDADFVVIALTECKGA